MNVGRVTSVLDRIGSKRREPHDLSAPGRALGDAATGGQLRVDETAVDALLAVDRAATAMAHLGSRFEAGLAKPVRQAAHVTARGVNFLGDTAVGVAHGTAGLTMGAVNLVAGLQQFLTSPRGRAAFWSGVRKIAQDPVGYFKGVGEQGGGFFRECPPYVLGDFASLAVGPGAVLAATGSLAWAALALVGSAVLARASPQTPDPLPEFQRRKSSGG